MSCPRNSFVGFPSRSTGSPLTKSIGTTSITRGCLSSTLSVFRSFRQRSSSTFASRQLPTVFLCCFRFARVIALPLCRNASPDRRSVSGRTSDYTGRNTWWRRSCTAHPREKRPDRILRPAYLLLCLDFLERRCDPRGSTLLTLLRGHRIEGCPPLLYVLAFAVGADNLALPMLRDCQEFRELFLAGSTEIIVLGHDSLPVENSSQRRA